MPAWEDVECTMRNLLPVLLIITSVTWAVDDCHFSPEIQMETHEVALTCRCNISTVRCQLCTMKIQRVDIKPVSHAMLAAVNVREVSTSSKELPNGYAMHKTYGITVEQGLVGVSRLSRAKVKFECVTQGLDYTYHAKDEDYFLEINLLDFYRRPSTTMSSPPVTTSSTPLSLRTTPTFRTENTTPQEVATTADKPETSAVNASETITFTLPRAVFKQTQKEESVLDAETWLGISVRMLILLVTCCVLLLIVVTLIIFIVVSRRRRKQLSAPPAFCGRQINNDVELQVFDRLLTYLTSSRGDQHQDHTQVYPDNIYDEPQISTHIYDEPQSNRNSSADSAYEACDSPTAFIEASDHRTSGELVDEFADKYVPGIDSDGYLEAMAINLATGKSGSV